MRVAVDIDGTITAHPERLAATMRALREAGHEVIVLSGSLYRATALYDSIDWLPCMVREVQLHEIGLRAGRDYDRIVVSTAPTTDGVARGKGRYVVEHGIDMVFEDTPMYLDAIRAAAPGVACWLLYSGPS